MISFVWPPGVAMLAGTGGSETYTAGHVQELLRRGIKAQVVTIGHGVRDGREDFPGIPFLALDTSSQISDLPGVVVFVNRSYPVKTRNKAILILHCVVTRPSERVKRQAEIVDKLVIATSTYSAQQWALFLDVPSSRIHIVLPFADPVFGNIHRAKTTKKIRIVYAGRLHPEKGVYTVLEMMHAHEMQKNGYAVSLVKAGLHCSIGIDIARMLEGYPYARLVDACKSVLSMSLLLAKNDILLMPSVCDEAFGMLSVEAQHAGCRVVASNLGGLPETNCGLLTLVEARDPAALIDGIKQAVALGPATKKQRAAAASHFTLNESVTSLLKLLPASAAVL